MVEKAGSGTGDVVVRVSGLHKTYRDFWGRSVFPALRGVDLEVRRGESHALLGPNGSGKTTTLRILLGLLAPTSGEVRLLGGDPRSPATRRRVGFLPESSTLHGFLRCQETLELYGRLHGLARSECRARASSLLERVELLDAAKKRVRELSHGMRRRLAFAVALVGEPDVLVLDEPTAGMDPLVRERVLALIQEHVAAGGSLLVTGVQREEIAKNVAHYSFYVRVGPRPYDRIRLHRVVKEPRPNHPARNLDGLFVIPGAFYRFDNLFLAAVNHAGTPNEHSFPVYLAQKGVDVWGIDLGWSLVPPGTADLSFMEGWGAARDARHVLLGMAVARGIRAATLSGAGAMNLLGYSYGYTVGFVAAQQETQLPRFLRQIRGYIPIDGYFVCDDCQAYACDLLADQEAQMAGGIYYDESGGLFALLSQLASAAPDDPSPILPGLTNLQAVLLFWSQTFLLGPENPHYHIFAGLFDDNGLPFDLRYTPVDYALSWFENASTYFPLRAYADFNEPLCGLTDSPLDDHLGDLTIPVFYVASGGGTGDYGLPSLDLIGSDDVTSYVARLWPVGQETMDIGHVDIWHADNAQTMIWKPILDWLRKH